MGAMRFNTGKINISNIPFDVMFEEAKAMTFGEIKYPKDNWKKGLSVSSIIDSVMRHIGWYLSGEEIDPESGIHHLALARCNMMFLLWYSWHVYPEKPELDDRDSKFNTDVFKFTEQMKSWMEKKSKDSEEHVDK